MDYLTGVPSEHGLELLKNKLFEEIKKFELINDKDESYFSDEVHGIYFDNNGVLTITFLIPKDEHFLEWNKKIKITDINDKEVISYETPQIQFVKGVGGEQTAKLPVGGEASEVIFKKDDYITDTEASELFLSPLVANTNHLIALQNKLIEKEVILDA